MCIQYIYVYLLYIAHVFHCSFSSARLTYYKHIQYIHVGTARILNLEDEGDYGQMYKIVPMTNDSVTNEITCFKIPGVSEAPVMPQGVLPNGSLYTVCFTVPIMAF